MSLSVKMPDKFVKKSNSLGSTCMMFDKKTFVKKINHQESMSSFIFYTSFITIFAGAGLFFASFVLQILTKNPIMKLHPELIKLIPLLLGLKGSIEMTFASRLSTMANTDKLNSSRKLLKASFFNFALILGQAINVTLLAAGLILMSHLVFDGSLTSIKVVSFLLSILSTSTIASIFLAVMIVIIVKLAQILQINPDNICPPLAATVGDSLTLIILNYCASFIYKTVPETFAWIFVSLIIICGIGCVFIAWINDETREALAFGSISIIFSMFIGLLVGYIFHDSIEKHQAVSVYQLILNGIGGNLVSILASRTSTDLHKMTGAQKNMVQKQWFHFLNPIQMFREKRNCIIIISLIFIGLFVEILELIAVFFTSKNAVNHPIFSIMYLTSSLIQFFILFYTCMLLTRILFAKNIDPDNNAIPLLTALGDLTGTVFLAISLIIYKMVIKQHTL